MTQIQQKKGTSLAADVLDVGGSVATASTALFAPYEVATWSSIPAGLKSPTGLYTGDYGGYMSIGYDSAKFGTITSLSQLLGPQVQERGGAQRRSDAGQRRAERRDDGEPG